MSAIDSHWQLIGNVGDELDVTLRLGSVVDALGSSFD